MADEWWVVERFDDGIVLLTEPHVHPLLRCNVWLVQGSAGSMVVDTALGLRPLRGLVEQHLDGPLLAVATHAHGDHVGGFHEFDRRAVHEAEADVVAEAGLTTLVTGYFPADGHRPLPRRRLRHARAARRRGAGRRLRPVGGRHRPRRGHPGAARRRRHRPRRPAVRGAPPARATPPAASGCGRPPPARCSPATRSTTARCSTSSTAPTSTRTSRPWNGSGRCPVTVVHGGHEPSFGRDRLVELCDAYLARRSP